MSAFKTATIQSNKLIIWIITTFYIPDTAVKWSCYPSQRQYLTRAIINSVKIAGPDNL